MTIARSEAIHECCNDAGIIRPLPTFGDSIHVSFWIRYMRKRIKLPPTMKNASRMKPGKGWRLVNAKRTGSLKAALMSTFTSSGERYAVFRVRK